MFEYSKNRFIKIETIVGAFYNATNKKVGINLNIQAHAKDRVVWTESFQNEEEAIKYLRSIPI